MISTEWMSFNEHSNYILKSVYGIEDFDNNNIYLVAFEGEKPAATAAFTLFKDGIKIFNLAVLEEFRNQGIGDLILRLMIRRGFDMGFDSQYAFVPEKHLEYCKKLKFTETGESENNNILMVHHGDIIPECNKN